MNNIAMITMHGSMSLRSRKVSKHVLDRFPGKVYVLTISPYGGYAYLAIVPLLMRMIQLGGITFVKELIDFINRKPKDMIQTLDYMESDLFKLYESAFLIYIFMMTYYTKFFKVYGDVIHDILNVYTKNYPPPNVDLYPASDLDKTSEELIVSSPYNANIAYCSTNEPIANINPRIYQAAYTRFGTRPEYEALLSDTGFQVNRMAIINHPNTERNECMEGLNSLRPNTYKDYETFRIAMGVYTSNPTDKSVPVSDPLFFTTPMYYSQVNETNLENLMSYYSSYATGDTYIILTSCKYIPDAIETTYRRLNPAYTRLGKTVETEVKSTLIPPSRLSQIHSRYGRSDLPAYEGRSYKPLSRISSKYTPSRSSAPKTFKRVTSRRRDVDITSITVDPDTIRSNEYLLYILRKSMHHCFPNTYSDPDLQESGLSRGIMSTLASTVTGRRIGGLRLWNPTHDVALFFTRIGGREIAPRLFFEVVPQYMDTVKIQNLCSTHLGNIGLSKKEKFVKGALNLWVSENNPQYTIQADIRTKSEGHRDKLLHIFTSEDGAGLQVKEVVPTEDGDLYMLELPKGYTGSFEAKAE